MKLKIILFCYDSAHSIITFGNWIVSFNALFQLQPELYIKQNFCSRIIKTQFCFIVSKAIFSRLESSFATMAAL